MPKLSVVIIAYNEEAKLEACLLSASFADEIVVVDSFSTDRTPEICKKYGVKFFTRAFDDFSAQKNFAIEKAQGDWILSLDADERIPEALKNEILRVLEESEGPCEGYWIRRLNHAFGGALRFGAGWNDRQLRLFRKGRGRFRGTIHERVCVDGPVGCLKNRMEHCTFQDLFEYYRRFDRYTTLEAQAMIARGATPSWFDMAVKPFLGFVYFYIFRLGFLDGRVGFQNQIHASFYTYVKYGKAMDLRRRQASHNR